MKNKYIKLNQLLVLGVMGFGVTCFAQNSCPDTSGKTSLQSVVDRLDPVQLDPSHPEDRYSCAWLEHKNVRGLAASTKREDQNRVLKALETPESLKAALVKAYSSQPGFGEEKNRTVQRILESNSDVLGSGPQHDQVVSAIRKNIENFRARHLECKGFVKTELVAQSPSVRHYAEGYGDLSKNVELITLTRSGKPFTSMEVFQALRVAGDAQKASVAVENELNDDVNRWRSNGKLICSTPAVASPKNNHVVNVVEDVEIKASAKFENNSAEISNAEAARLRKEITDQIAEKMVLRPDLKCHSIEGVDLEGSSSKVANSIKDKSGKVDASKRWNFAALSNSRAKEFEKEVIKLLPAGLGISSVNTTNFAYPPTDAQATGATGDCPYVLVEKNGLYHVEEDPTYFKDPVQKEKLKENQYVSMKIHFNSKSTCGDLAQGRPHWSADIYTNCVRVVNTCSD